MMGMRYKNLAAKPEKASRSVTILGSTGSIGVNTLDLVGQSKGRFHVVAMTANSRVDDLAVQALTHRPTFVALADETAYKALKEALSGSGIECAAGADAVCHAASLPSDMVMAGIVGTAGLRPTLAAVERGATIGLANKECLVSAGQLLMNRVRGCGATLLPVDSEHNAIFQVFDFDNPDKVERIILTASGGPFRTTSLEAMAVATPAQAIAHPNWSMGAKISVDSANMMNKGLEYIEAYHLFPLDRDQIDIVIHPQSVVHSMVAYRDGSVLAQLGSPDMRVPIGYALAWPDRMPSSASRLDVAALGNLGFEAPDEVRFPALRLAREALSAGGNAAICLNAANEVAVGAFLERRIGFLDIVRVVEKVLDRVEACKATTLEDVFEQDLRARELVNSVIETL